MALFCGQRLYECMIAHSLRISGYDAEINEREHAPQFLRAGFFLSACVGMGLFSFFNSFEHKELISSYGLWFLIVYDGLTINAVASLLFALSGILYTVSAAIFPDS